MKTISLKLDESVFGDTENILEKVKKSRNRYINEALDYYNKYQERLLLEKRLKIESAIVSEDSMEVLGEFEAIEYGD